jgi:hypothetical protein
MEKILIRAKYFHEKKAVLVYLPTILGKRLLIKEKIWRTT